MTSYYERYLSERYGFDEYTDAVCLLSGSEGINQQIDFLVE